MRAGAVDLQGIKFDTNHGGVIPLTRYFQATIVHREELLSGKSSIEKVAEERSLNPKYLGKLWEALVREDRETPGLGLSKLQEMEGRNDRRCPATRGLRRAIPHVFVAI